MDIELIFEPDMPPDQLAEMAVAAENYCIRTLWASNFWAHWDAFLLFMRR